MAKVEKTFKADGRKRKKGTEDNRGVLQYQSGYEYDADINILEQDVQKPHYSSIDGFSFLTGKDIF